MNSGGKCPAVIIIFPISHDKLVPGKRAAHLSDVSAGTDLSEIIAKKNHPVR